MIKLDLSLTAKRFLLLIWIALFIGGAIQYTGSGLTYTIFSLVFLVMLVCGICQQVSYGYFFLVVMLWLGFWLKLTIHLLVDYPYAEPVGSFVGSPAAWDKVLWIATIGCIGVMLGKFIHNLSKPQSVMLVRGSLFKIPSWYFGKRRWIWAFFLIICLALAIVNAWLGILQVGLAPRTILWWPLNAVISWLVGYGLTFGIATLLWWDIALGRNISLVVYFVLLEGATATVSLLSRGAYIFHVIPQFMALYKNRNLISGWSRKNIIAVCAVFIVLFALTNPLVNAFRNFYYSGVPLPFLKKGELTVNITKNSVIPFAKFAVDRWIGVEGVMAVSAYPEKSLSLFAEGIEERAEVGKSTIYQKICQSHYRFMDMYKFQFSSLPGAIGFLYFAGHWWVVGLGMIVLSLAMLSSEGLVFRLTRNPLLSALWGGAAANTIVQIGTAPRGAVFYFFEMSCGIAVIFFVQSKYFSRILLQSGTLIIRKNRV